jgi:hypothetical protein
MTAKLTESLTWDGFKMMVVTLSKTILAKAFQQGDPTG